MKARTLFEKRVEASNERLATIDSKAVNWAVRKLIEHPAFRTPSKTTTCGDCGHQFRYEGRRLNVLCPKCRNLLKVTDTLKRKKDEEAYFATLDTIDGLQVERVYHLSVQYRKGMAVSVDYNETCRLWLNAKGQIALTSRKRNYSYYMDSFNLSSKIELRSVATTHLVISNVDVYPKYKLIPELKRNGMRGKLPNCHPFRLMAALLNDNRIETLVKAKNKEAVSHFVSNPSNLDLCWNSHKIAMRRGYVISDYGLWCDTIRLLDKCGRDIHSEKYICPTNLNAAHDKWCSKYQAMERKRLDVERMKRAKEKEIDFYKNKSRYFDIVITDNEIEVSVLDSIEAYKAEGDAMHHCVFSCEYFANVNSLILSARDKRGNRIATVEYSLVENKVVQCRGLCNTLTEQQERIVNLINANAYRFVKAKATA